MDQPLPLQFVKMDPFPFYGFPDIPNPYHLLESGHFFPAQLQLSFAHRQLESLHKLVLGPECGLPLRARQVDTDKVYRLQSERETERTTN